MINLLLLSNFCPVISFWQIQNDKLTNYCIYTVWSLFMVREPIATRKRLNIPEIRDGREKRPKTKATVKNVYDRISQVKENHLYQFFTTGQL